MNGGTCVPQTTTRGGRGSRHAPALPLRGEGGVTLLEYETASYDGDAKAVESREQLVFLKDDSLLNPEAKGILETYSNANDDGNTINGLNNNKDNDIADPLSLLEYTLTRDHPLHVVESTQESRKRSIGGYSRVGKQAQLRGNNTTAQDDEEGDYATLFRDSTQTANEGTKQTSVNTDSTEKFGRLLNSFWTLKKRRKRGGDGTGVDKSSHPGFQCQCPPLYKGEIAVGRLL